jgi:hypothetical protein
VPGRLQFWLQLLPASNAREARAVANDLREGQPRTSAIDRSQTLKERDPRGSGVQIPPLPPDRVSAPGQSN